MATGGNAWWKTVSVRCLATWGDPNKGLKELGGLEEHWPTLHRGLATTGPEPGWNQVTKKSWNQTDKADFCSAPGRAAGWSFEGAIMD